MPNLTETFDLVKRSSEIRSSECFPLIWHWLLLIQLKCIIKKVTGKMAISELDFKKIFCRMQFFFRFLKAFRILFVGIINVPTKPKSISARLASCWLSVDSFSTLSKKTKNRSRSNSKWLFGYWPSKQKTNVDLVFKKTCFEHQIHEGELFQLLFKKLKRFFHII